MEKGSLQWSSACVYSLRSPLMSTLLRISAAHDGMMKQVVRSFTGCGIIGGLRGRPSLSNIVSKLCGRRVVSKEMGLDLPSDPR